MSDLERFQKQLNKIQNIVLALEESWLNKEQIPLMHIMLECLISININIYEAYSAAQKLPSFTPFSSMVLNSLIGENQYNNPFSATAHPGFDQKLLELRQHHIKAPIQTLSDLFRYYNKILDTEPQLKQELKKLYQDKYGVNNTELHVEVRQNDLEALFIISEQYNHRLKLAPKFDSLINKINIHLSHEECLRELLNPFYINKYAKQFSIAIHHKNFRINSALFPNFVPYETLDTTIKEHKYNLSSSPAQRALDCSVCNKSRYVDFHLAKSANQIQLNSEREIAKNSSLQVTQEDIIERDYFHLRSEPEFQIALTLDYFHHFIERCADENNQRYIEANLFQPGLLLNSLNDSEFLPQFDRFLQAGLRYFTDHGQHTKTSLFFLRLNYLVSRYLKLNSDPRGKPRLLNIRAEIEKQLNSNASAELSYVLNEYLLLTFMEQDKEYTTEDFYCAYNAYVYLQGHNNPQILTDKAHQIEVESMMTRFQALIFNQSHFIIEKAIKNAAKNLASLATEEFTLKGSPPIYQINTLTSLKQYEFDALSGKLYEKNFTLHELPLSLQHHPLIKQLELDTKSQYLISSNDNYMILNHKNDKVFLFYDKEQLTVQREWTIAGVKNKYELHALSQDHQAFYANKKTTLIHNDLPKILNDGTMNFWKNTLTDDQGLLVRNNIPVYALHDNKWWALDEKGNETGYQLQPVDELPAALKEFEDEEFLLKENKNSENKIHLPRFNLHFKQEKEQLICCDTSEEVCDLPSPIHSSVAGIILSQHAHQRYLVPIARFFATDMDALASDFYPLVHDTHGVIAEHSLHEYWSHYPPVQKPLWNYSNSEAYVSYPLENEEIVSDNLSVADALYLTYIYLATNQTEKAWQILAKCNTSLGSLTGDPKELQYIYWIGNHLPHILPSKQSE